MNTRKQVLIMTGLLLVMLMVLGVYAAWYPYRAKDAQVHFDEATAERAAIVFARNCRLCHGDVGEGGAAGARLPAAPALHRADLMGFVDSDGVLTSDINATQTTFDTSSSAKLKTGMTILINDEWMDLKNIDGKTLTVSRPAGYTHAEPHSKDATISFRDPAVLKDKIKLITNTVTCGRVGTAMPAWGQSQGGPLSDEQIRQLTVLITQSHWDLVKEEVDKEDMLTAHLTDAMDDSTISMRVNDVSIFTEKDAIRIGDERLRVTGVPRPPQGKTWAQVPAKDRGGIIEVQRGVLGSTPLEHTPEDEIFKFPEVATPATNAASCGQFAQAPAPAGTPVIIPDPFEGQSATLVASNLAFDKKEITAKTGGKIRVRLDNKDVGVDHNVAFYKSATETQAVSPGSVGVKFPGAAVGDTAFDVPAAGKYFFRCDVHPQTMTGTFTVTN
jgi:plastocyanin/mono/diheme cytochrome c family protein